MIWSNKKDIAIPAEIPVEGKLWHKSLTTDVEYMSQLLFNMQPGKQIPIEGNGDVARGPKQISKNQLHMSY